MRKFDSIVVNFEDLIDSFHIEDRAEKNEVRNILSKRFQFGYNKNTGIALRFKEGIDINFIETESFH